MVENDWRCRASTSNALRGVWTASTFYNDMQKDLAKEKTKRSEEATKQSEAEKETARLRLEAEKEQSTRQKSDHDFTTLSAQDNHQFQLGITDARIRQLEAEAKQAEAEVAVAKARADEQASRDKATIEQLRSAAAEAEKQREAARAIAQSEALKQIGASITALSTKPSAEGNDEATLLLLGAHAKETEFRIPILRALEVRLARPLKTPGEELAAVRLGEDLLPDSFDVLSGLATKANALATELRWLRLLTTLRDDISDELKYITKPAPPLIPSGNARPGILDAFSQGFCGNFQLEFLVDFGLNSTYPRSLEDRRMQLCEPTRSTYRTWTNFQNGSAPDL